MRELIACWKHTRLIVLIGLCGALYVAVLLPFKIAVIIPGITEIRPGAALPIVFSIFFGPAAAWGAGRVLGRVVEGMRNNQPCYIFWLLRKFRLCLCTLSRFTQLLSLQRIQIFREAVGSFFL